MKPIVLDQQLPEETATVKPTSRSWNYAVPLTLDACRCPHLQAFLPHVLDLECVRNCDTNTWQISNPVHSLHLASQLNPDGKTVSLGDADSSSLYGEEQRRASALGVGGIADSYFPVEAPRSKKVYSRGVPKSKVSVKVLLKNPPPTSVSEPPPAETGSSAAEGEKKRKSTAVSSGNKEGTELSSVVPTVAAEAPSSLGETSSLCVGKKETLVPIENASSNTNDKQVVPLQVMSDPATPASQNETMTPSDTKGEAATVTSDMEVTSGDADKNSGPELNSKPEGESTTTITTEKDLTNVFRDTDAIGAKMKELSHVQEKTGEAKIGKEELKPQPTVSSIGATVSRSSEPEADSSVPQPKLGPTAVLSGAPSIMTTSEDMEKKETVPVQGETATSDTRGDESEKKSLSATDAVVSGTERSSTQGDSETGETKAPGRNVEASNQSAEPVSSAPPPAEYFLPFSRYHHLRQMEDRILKKRRTLASKRKVQKGDSNKRKPSSTKKRKGSSKSGDPNNTKSLALLNLNLGGNNLPVQFDGNDVQWEQDAMRARGKVEDWMEALRLNRRICRDSKLQGRTSKKKNGMYSKMFGSLENNPNTEQQCDLSQTKETRGFRRARCTNAKGDELLQCLECSFVGCAPCSVYPSSQQHIIQHMLKTGHNVAISCGSRADIFCFRCGDFVYHEVFDQEKERLDVSQKLPWMGWKQHAIQRSFDAFNFVTTPDHGVVWRGLTATYPSLVPKEYLSSARLSMKRLLMFQGEVENGSLTWGSEARDFAAHQRLNRDSSWRLSAPVGLFNLGNTCFMGAVLQCLVHCLPLQRHFLGDVGHHHESCILLRHASAKSELGNASASVGVPTKIAENRSDSKGKDICLACEMDMLFLRYFGSTVGKDVVGAVREPTGSNTLRIVSGGPKALMVSAPEQIRGEPLVASDLLTAAWRSGGMDHLAGYEQRDAHEFLQAFLDIMGKHASQHRKRIRKFLGSLNLMGSLQTDSRLSDDVTKCLFEGTLRSVLICGECGCKRSLSEPFLNISLPLAKEMERSADARAGSTVGTRLSASRLKISVQQCLQHFTAPEALGDPVHCPSCKKKTTTKKQHTFAKLPRVLCLHLKRFDAANNKKIDDFVSFPAYGLDMGPHLPHWCEVMQGVDTSGKTGDSRDSSSPRVLYDLFGTVCHTGNLNQGHYVANVKVGGQWYHCNDAFVESTSDAEVLKSDGAYVLFYIRRENN